MPGFRVATFNVHHCEGLDGRMDIERTASVIAETDADLVALQELDRGMNRTSGTDQPAELQRLTGMQVDFFKTLERGGGDFGVGVAHRGDGGPFEFRWLPMLGDEEPRGCWIGSWKGITAIGVHLSLPKAPNFVQTQALVRMCRDIEGPILLMGDLNQSSWAFRRAGGDVFDVPWPPRRTMARRWAQRDHIIGANGVRVRRRYVYPSPASDHYALAAEIEVA